MKFADKQTPIYEREYSINEETKVEEKKKYSIWDCFKVSYAFYVLLVLGFISIFRTIQRGFLSIVAVPVQRDLKISDGLFGAINGPIFSLFFAISGVIFGRLGDVYSRRALLMLMMLISSTFVAAHSFVKKDWHLVIVRIGFACGISGISSISMSILTDYFGEKSRPIVLGLYNYSAFIGVGGQFAMGGFVDEATSNWKTLFLFLAAPSLISIYLLYYTVEEPERGALDTQKNVKKTTILESLKFLLGNITLWCLCIASGCGFFMINSSQVWGPTFYRRVFGLSPTDLSKYLTWIQPIGGTLGTVCGGIIGSKLPSMNKRWYSVVLTITFISILIIQAGVYLIPNVYVSLVFTMIGSFFGLFGIPSIFMLSITIVPISMKSTSIAFLNLFLGGIGSFGPLFVGYLNSLNPPYFDMKDNPESIRWSLFLVSTVSFSLTAFFSFLMFFFIQRDYKRLEDWYQANKKTPENSDEIVL